MAGGSRANGCLVWIVWLVIVVIAVALYSLFGNTHSDDSQKSNHPDARLSVQSEPPNGALLNGSSFGNAVIRVTAAQGESAYVKARNNSNGTVVGFFVKSGQTAESSVPSGSYSIHFATGETWYGQTDRFGSKTAYGQDENVFLQDGSIVTYRLQRSSGGNFSMKPLDASEF